LRIQLLGIEVDALTADELSDIVSGSVYLGKHRIIANHNLHSLYLYHHDSDLRTFFAVAHKIHIDGMPLVHLARLFGFPVLPEHRVTYLDWLPQLIEIGERQDWRFFYLGGKPGVAEEAARRLRAAHPALQLATHHGYFGSVDHVGEAVLEALAHYKPNVLMVGMGMPLQERWILQNLDRLNVDVVLTAGACFDYIAGASSMPPRWMGRAGLEWLFRLATEPRRLSKRYLLEPWYVLALVLAYLVRRALKRADA